MQVGTSGFMRAVDVPAERKLTSVSSGGLVHSSYHTSLAFIATPAPRGSIAIDLDRI